MFLFLYGIAQIADIITTVRVMSQGGRELNPVVAWLMGKLGKGWYFVKFGVSMLVALILTTSGHDWAVGILAVVVGAVAFNNWRQIK